MSAEGEKMTDKWEKKDYLPIIKDTAEAIAVAQTANIMSDYDAWAKGSELDLWLERAAKSLLRILKDDNEAAQQRVKRTGYVASTSDEEKCSGCNEYDCRCADYAAISLR
jgi:dsDNA-binding SOS-regulon protein